MAFNLLIVYSICSSPIVLLYLSLRTFDLIQYVSHLTLRIDIGFVEDPPPLMCLHLITTLLMTSDSYLSHKIT